MSPWIRWRVMRAAALELTSKANVIGNDQEPGYFELVFEDRKLKRRYHLRLTRSAMR